MPMSFVILDRPDNPKLGYFYAVMSGIFYTFVFLIYKILFVRVPTLNSMELIFLRSSSASLVVLLYENLSLKRVAWDTVEPDQVQTLHFRVVQGLLSICMSAYTVKYFSLIVNGVFWNMTPMFVVIMSWIMLKETLKAY
mmetsp:Transcript_15094/g.10571  ORF Transcript_15094/g.10571 Transcript_15094/m.10571 type:complete len:139 (+) Transcript_15094:281-697(+)